MCHVTRSGQDSTLEKGSRYKSKLLAAKEARKLVEQDAQLLANRIALLKVGRG